MNRAERRAQQYRVPANNLRVSRNIKHLSAPRIVVMHNAATEPMEALKAWIDTYEDPAAPAMSHQALVLLCGLWLGLTRGLYLQQVPLPRDDERAGNNILARLYAGAVLPKSDLQRMHFLMAAVVNRAMQVKGWEVWAEAATDLAIKNEFAKRQREDGWIGGWKHEEQKA